MTTHVITKGFLEKALGEPIDNFEINSGSNLGDGYSSVLFTIDVVLQQNKGRRHLLLKCYPTHPARQELMSKMNIFDKELKIYDTLIPTLTSFQKDWLSKEEDFVKLPFPQFYFGQAIDYTKQDSMLCEDPMENCIMMEDLRKTRGFRLADRVKGFDLAHAQLVMIAQAKFHSISWIYKCKSKVDSLTQLVPSIADGFLDGMEPDMWNAMYDNSHSMFQQAINAEIEDEDEKNILLQSVANARAKTLDTMDLYIGGKKDKANWDKITSNKDNWLRIPGKIKDDEALWSVALHVDARLDNMLFRYDDQGNPLEVILVDLQTIMEGDPICDICNTLFTSTNPSPWKIHSEELLQLYMNTFVDICLKFGEAPPPDFNLDELKRRFHRGKLYGFMMALMCLPLLLNDPKNAVDMEKMNKDVKRNQVLDVMADMITGVSGNQKFNKLVVEVVRDLYGQGII